MFWYKQMRFFDGLAHDRESVAATFKPQGPWKSLKIKIKSIDITSFSLSSYFWPQNLPCKRRLVRLGLTNCLSANHLRESYVIKCIFINQTKKVWKWVPSRSFLHPCATVKNPATPPFACHRRSREPLARFSPPWQATRICCRGKHEHIDAVLQELTGAETAA